jgi:5-methyltetrahydrofolate--homocysteine methyltransferase
MAIVNAGQLDVYDTIDPELREACEDVILDRREDSHRAASSRLPKSIAAPIRCARKPKPNGAAGTSASASSTLVKGIDAFVVEETEKRARRRSTVAGARSRYRRAR